MLLRRLALFTFIPRYIYVSAFDLQATNNVALYWGQNSARKPTSTISPTYLILTPTKPELTPQPPLKSYCTRPEIDIIILSFIATLYSAEKIPILNHVTEQCSPTNTPGGQVVCPELAMEIEYCRGLGKKVLVSLGGATAGYEIGSEVEAVNAANQVWNTYLGGAKDGTIRPFGEVELDGIDLDLESPSGQEGLYWPIFIETIRSLYQTQPGRNGKTDYLISASPQCVYPDVILSPALRDKRSWFDMLFIQFYNNICAPTNPTSFNFNEWAEWARSSSLNPNVKLFIGSPASPAAAPSGGFTPLETLLEISSESMEDCEAARVFWNSGASGTNSTSSGYNPFGGIAFWDASWTSAEYTAATKAGLTGSWERVKARNQFFKRQEFESKQAEGEAESAAERGKSRGTSSTGARASRRRHTIRRRHRHRR
ncbi:hypothetical protein TWF281_004973 [Arthrobotrys megalospora]